MLCMSGMIYLYVVFLCRPVNDVAFIHLWSAEPMLLSLVVSGRSLFLCVLSSPRLLGRVATVCVVPSNNEVCASRTTNLFMSF